jgi:hypothetical protein
MLLLLSVGCYCVWRRKRRERHGETDSSSPPLSGVGDEVLQFRARK